MCLEYEIFGLIFFFYFKDEDRDFLFIIKYLLSVCRWFCINIMIGFDVDICGI